mmetsp:Transcript_13139/g.37290  ORF Transcript_13139/g.37290 Transcript_13139/m.37290 type:complete len:384 (-) Transcript_13139:945-2096(-)
MLQDPLNHTATIRVRCQGADFSGKVFHNKMYELRRDAFDALLDDVVAILVLDTLHHITHELRYNRALLLHIDDLKSLLDHTATVDLQGEVQNVASQRLAKQFDLAVRAVLKELLDDVVTEHVHHEAERMGMDLAKDQITLLRGGFFQLLLDEAGAVLVATKLNYAPLDVLQAELTVLVVAELLEEGTAVGIHCGLVPLATTDGVLAVAGAPPAARTVTMVVTTAALASVLALHPAASGVAATRIGAPSLPTFRGGARWLRRVVRRGAVVAIRIVRIPTGAKEVRIPLLLLVLHPVSVPAHSRARLRISTARRGGEHLLVVQGVHVLQGPRRYRHVLRADLRVPLLRKPRRWVPCLLPKVRHLRLWYTSRRVPVRHIPVGRRVR